MSDLLIVESPAKAKTIGKYLPKFKVLSSYGHVRGLPSEKNAVIPEEDFKMVYKNVERSDGHIKDIITAAKKANIIYLATDPDREGEAIAWHIAEILRENKVIKKLSEVKRVTFYEITKDAIIEAVGRPTALNEALIESQRTRQALDWLVGFTLSPLLWSKIPGKSSGKGALSAGRVQSVALRIICEVEDQIAEFKQEEYWTVQAQCSANKDENFDVYMTHFDGQKLEKFSIVNEKRANEIVIASKKLKYSVLNVETTDVRRKPKAPFNTSKMLQEAGRKLGFSAKKTAHVAQKLYEGIAIGAETVGLITYMRTDSVHISESARVKAKAFISAQYGDNYLPEKERKYKTETKNAQEAHEAIRPTNVEYTPDIIAKYLDSDQQKLYGLIWRRFVASQMADAMLEATSINIADSKSSVIFRATGSVVKFDGFMLVDKPSKSEEMLLPKLERGNAVDISDIAGAQHFTQPPPRYTDASLVKKMEQLGIGRPSTYPSIIGILQDRGYVKMEKKTFIPDIKGKLVNAFLTNFFEKYVEYSFTANLESELDLIASNNKNLKEVLSGFWTPFKDRADNVMKEPRQDVLEKIKTSIRDFALKELDSKECTKCTDGILDIKFGRYGPFVGCSNYPECKNIININMGANSSSEDADNAAAKVSNSEFPKILGNDPDTGLEVSVRKGPYSYYVQLSSEPPKRASVMAKVVPSEVTLEYALQLLSMPRKIGMHPESGEQIEAGFGRFGPYIKYMNEFISIKGSDPTTITLEEALQAIEAKKNKPAFRGRAKKDKT